MLSGGGSSGYIVSSCSHFIFLMIVFWMAPLQHDSGWHEDWRGGVRRFVLLDESFSIVITRRRAMPRFYCGLASVEVGGA